jgi:UDP-MurNAc hydroxylase
MCVAEDAAFEKPTIRYLGHAGFVFEYQGASILMDPWFYAGNLGSIFPFPDNAFVMDSVLARKFDYLYISHSHTDHYDRRFLKNLDRTTTILCPGFKSRELEWIFEDMGFTNIISMGHMETRRLNDHLAVTMILDASSIEDSGILVDAGGFRFLNLNDCQSKVSELPQADVLACQFSGAIHYPQTYDIYTEAQKAARVETAIETYVDIFERKINAVRPKYFLPSAGPFCFLHPSLMNYNPQPGVPTVFVDWESFAIRTMGFLPPQAILRIFPGDVVSGDAKTKVCVFEDHYSSLNPFPEDTLEAYAARRAAETANFYAEVAPTVSTEELAAHWSNIQRQNRRLLAYRDFSKQFTIEAFEQSGAFLRRWHIHIGEGGAAVHDTTPADFASAYTFKLPMLMLRKVIDDETNWDEMVASHHMVLSRDPDIFDPQFFALLRYHHVPMRGRLFVLAGESDEMIPLKGAPGVEVQRYCPHAGEDLIEVEACNGVLTCPRHRWEWDIVTGQCLQGGNLPLKIRRAEQAETDVDPVIV